MTRLPFLEMSEIVGPGPRLATVYRGEVKGDLAADDVTQDNSSARHEGPSGSQGRCLRENVRV